MFGIGTSELLVIFIIALLVFGADKLPELARTLGKISGEVKKNHDMLRKEFYNAVYSPLSEQELQKKPQLSTTNSLENNTQKSDSVEPCESNSENDIDSRQPLNTNKKN